MNHPTANPFPIPLNMRWSLPLFAILFSLLLTACDRQPERAAPVSNAAAATGDDKNVILVGEFGSLTGAQATFGQSTSKGIKLAVDQVNAAGGVSVGGVGPAKKIKVKTYDDQGKAQEAGTAVTRLITDDKVVAVLGEVASTLSLAGAPVCQQFGVPMISPSSTNPKVTQVGDMIFRVCFIDPFQGYVGAKFIREFPAIKGKNVAVLYDQSQAYSVGLKDSFVKAFKNMGGTILTEQSFKGGDQDFNAQLTTIRDLKPDAIYLPGYYTDVGNVAVQARKLGITAPFIGGDGWESDKLTEIGGDAIEGGYFSNHYALDNSGPEAIEFVNKFKVAYKSEPDAMAALGFDAAMILIDSLKRAKSTGGKDLAAAIASTKDYHGVTGVISINRERNADKSAVMLKIEKGKPKFVVSVEPPK